MKAVTSMQFANFNITFGENNSPMLEYFENIVFPAFTGDYIRGKRDDLPRYFFENVQVKEIDDEYVMVGNYVKETEYKVITTVHEGELVNSPADIPTAPYSRFLIFLKNHRMVLVRNETGSPDIRSFQKTVREILSTHIREENRKREKENKLPIAIVHIVDIPLKHCVIYLDTNLTARVRRNLVKLENDPAEEGFTGFCRNGAMLYKDYQCRDQVKYLSVNTQVQVLYKLPGLGHDADEIYVVSVDGETMYMKVSTVSESKLRPATGGGGSSSSSSSDVWTPPAL